MTIASGTSERARETGSHGRRDAAPDRPVGPAAAPLPERLSGAEVQRYRRNAEFLASYAIHPTTGYDLQARLECARVTVLGLGGLGSYVASALGAAGVGELTLVDDDLDEERHLPGPVRSASAAVETVRVTAARDRIAAVNPMIKITAVAARVAGVADARAFLAGRDLLVCAVNRPRVDLVAWLQAAAVAEQVPWIRGTSDALTVSTFLQVPGTHACSERSQHRALAGYPWDGALFRFARDVLEDRTVNPRTVPSAGLTGAATALAAVTYLTGVTVAGRGAEVDRHVQA